MSAENNTEPIDLNKAVEMLSDYLYQRHCVIRDEAFTEACRERLYTGIEPSDKRIQELIQQATNKLCLKIDRRHENLFPGSQMVIGYWNKEKDIPVLQAPGFIVVMQDEMQRIEQETADNYKFYVMGVDLARVNNKEGND